MKPIFRYTGSKWRIAKWIIQYFPKHAAYIEPFAGSASVLLRKSPSKFEVYNDTFGEVVNVFRILRDPAMCELLERALMLTPYSRDEYYAAFEPPPDGADNIESARRFLVRCGMAFGSIGGTRKSPSGWAATPDRSASWAGKYLPAEFAQWAERMKTVQIDNRDALDVIRQYDAPNALFYCDPPYSADLWGDSKTVYQSHSVDHAVLLDVLNEAESYVVLSGYQSDMYAEKLRDWQVVTKTAYTANSKAGRRTEYLWISPRTWEALNNEEEKQ